MLFFFFLLRFWHSLHHRNVNVGPWSGLAMHPVEGFPYLSGILIHFLLPSHPIHVIFHMYPLSLWALYSHAGFDKMILRDTEAMKAGSFHHQLHHRYFECSSYMSDLSGDTVTPPRHARAFGEVGRIRKELHAERAKALPGDRSAAMGGSFPTLKPGCSRSIMSLSGCVKVSTHCNRCTGRPRWC
ncbi:sterol desaturase family protein [uncultured Roseobacter sp.]|uniref:sterol desaturase family protein n=1 Tax=uncultured Roseobacter sp. TaxID=114847 RepID=UPI00345C736A